MCQLLLDLRRHDGGGGLRVQGTEGTDGREKERRRVESVVCCVEWKVSNHQISVGGMN